MRIHITKIDKQYNKHTATFQSSKSFNWIQKYTLIEIRKNKKHLHTHNIKIIRCNIAAEQPLGTPVRYTFVSNGYNDTDHVYISSSLSLRATIRRFSSWPTVNSHTLYKTIKYVYNAAILYSFRRQIHKILMAASILNVILDFRT